MKAYLIHFPHNDTYWAKDGRTPDKRKAKIYLTIKGAEKRARLLKPETQIQIYDMTLLGKVPVSKV